MAKKFTCFQCATKISFVSEEIPELSKIANANDLCWITYERQVETGEKSNNRSKMVTFRISMISILLQLPKNASVFAMLLSMHIKKNWGEVKLSSILISNAAAPLRHQ